MLAFYLMGIIMDGSIHNYTEKKKILYIITGVFVLFIIKSFFGMAGPPFYEINRIRIAMIVICAILEVATIVALTICTNNTDEMAKQRDFFFYGRDE
jgi:hypothetical membrane protein